MRSVPGPRLGALTATVAAAGLIAACGSSGTGASTTTPAGSGARSLVALGDSVPSGYRCDCTPYPQDSAAGLAERTGHPVTATNDAVAGHTSAQVLEQLRSDEAVMDAVRRAEVVEVNVGANDVPYDHGGCGTRVDCYAPLVPPMREHLAAIVRRVHELSSGHRVLVVLLDYWSIWLGGHYARDKGQAYVDAAGEMTGRVNAAIRSIASETGSAYVDESKAFKGPSYSVAESRYLAADGEHPNAKGHEAIARAAETVIAQALHL